MTTSSGNKKASEPIEKPQLPPSLRKKKNAQKSILSSGALLTSATVAILGIAGYFTQSIWPHRAVLALESAGLGPLLGPDIIVQARTTEVANGMLEIYQTLADMQYIDPLGIEKGPHEIIVGPRIAPTISNEILQLWSKLPYVNTSNAGQTDFIDGSQFVDFRRSDDVVRSRDPYLNHMQEMPGWLDKADERYVSPHQTPLVNLGGEGLLMIYDVEQHLIWMLDHTGKRSVDPALKNITVFSGASKDIPNDFPHLPARPASQVLRDLVSGLKTLETVPGGGENSGLDGLWNASELAALYREHGWPKKFDSNGFSIAKTRWLAEARAKQSAEDPLREVEKYQSWAVAADNDLDTLRARLQAAETKSDEYIAKWEMFKLEGVIAKIVEDLKNATADAERLCPNGQCLKDQDLPLWTMEQLRADVETKTAQVTAYERQLARMTNESLPIEQRLPPEDIAAQKTALRHLRKELSQHQDAFGQANTEAEEARPGVSFLEATGISSLQKRTIEDEIAQARKALDWANLQVETYGAWISGVARETGLSVDESGTGGFPGGSEWPEDLMVFREKVEGEMGQLIRSHAGIKSHLERAVNWKKENVEKQ